jgi:hypothetical protein
MRHVLPTAALLIAATLPAAAQSQRAASGFSFDTCFNQCLSRGGSPGSCQPGCADRAATLARIPPGAKRSPNDDPRSPHFHDAEPRKPAW